MQQAHTCPSSSIMANLQLNASFSRSLKPIERSVCTMLGSLFSVKARIPTILPPGPPGDPLIGHFRHIPLSNSWFRFSDWSKAYGDVVYVRFFGRPMIILGSFDAARELMDKRGRKYSDRPRIVTHAELCVFCVLLRVVSTTLLTAMFSIAWVGRILSGFSSTEKSIANNVA